MPDFESRFERRLQAYAAIPARPVDADVVAHAVIAAHRPRFGVAWPIAGPRRALLVLTLLVAAVLGAMAAGYLLLRDPVPPGALVFARDDGLYLASSDGSEPRRIRDDGSYRDPRWSPSGDYIAVIRLRAMAFSVPAFQDLNEVLVLRPDGTQVGRWGLGESPGDCCPIGHVEWTRSKAGRAEGIVISFDPRRGIDPGIVIDTAGTTLLERRDAGGWASTDPRSRDLAVIVYAGAQDDVHGIWAFDPAVGTDGRARLVTERPPLSPGNAASGFNAIAVSPDGSTVAFIQSPGASLSGDLRVVPIGGGASTLLDTTASAASWLSFAPDGRSVLATLRRDERLEPYVVPLDGSSRSPLSTVRTPPSSVVPAWVRWAGGSRLLAMPRQMGSELGPAPVYTLEPDGTGLVRLADATNGADFRPLP